MKLTKGSTMPTFTFDTPYESGRDLYETVGQTPTFLLFLRYYGCTICQLDIHHLKENYEAFEQAGAKVMVVLQSKPEVIAKDVKQGELPFEIICDPQQKLYEQFEILPAKSKLGLASIATIKKIRAAKKAGLVHGAYEGEELQLPALFLLGNEGRVQFAHYAKNAADLPSHEEMLALVK